MMGVRELASLLVGSGRWMARSAVRGPHLVLAVFATCGLAWAYKRPLQSMLEGHGGIAGSLASAANLLGGGFAVTILGVSAFVLGRLFKKDALANAAIVFGIAGAWCFLLVHAGQLIFAERRPIEGGAMRFFALGGHGVSGHAAATALLALPVRDVLMRETSPLPRRVVTALLFAWVGIVAWSRVWLGMHHLWNVILGAALGLWTSASAVAAWRDSR